MKTLLITLLFLLPLALFAGACDVATQKKSRTHPITTEEIEKEIENNIHIIEACKDYSGVVREAELYNEYLLFKYLKLPTVSVNNNDLIERCRRIN